MRATFPGKWEQWDSVSGRGSTHLKLIVYSGRDKRMLERQMKEWHEHHPESQTILRSGREFRIMRTTCVHCEKKWYDHVPSGGQCLFASTHYLEAPRGLAK